jgi:hypothetical protein
VAVDAQSADSTLKDLCCQLAQHSSFATLVQSLKDFVDTLATPVPDCTDLVASHCTSRGSHEISNNEAQSATSEGSGDAPETLCRLTGRPFAQSCRVHHLLEWLLELIPREVVSLIGGSTALSREPAPGEAARGVHSRKIFIGFLILISPRPAAAGGMELPSLVVFFSSLLLRQCVVGIIDGLKFLGPLRTLRAIMWDAVWVPF